MSFYRLLRNFRSLSDIMAAGMPQLIVSSLVSKISDYSFDLKVSLPLMNITALENLSVTDRMVLSSVTDFGNPRMKSKVIVWNGRAGKMIGCKALYGQ